MRPGLAFVPTPQGRIRLGGVWTQIHHRATLIHVEAETHERVGIPEHLAILSRREYPSKAYIPGGCKAGSGDKYLRTRSWSDPAVSLLFEFAIICHAILITLEQECIISFPSSAFAHPAGTDKHHVV